MTIIWLSIFSQLDSNILQLLRIPGRILVPPVTQLFRSKWLQFFSFSVQEIGLTVQYSSLPGKCSIARNFLLMQAFFSITMWLWKGAYIYIPTRYWNVRKSEFSLTRKHLYWIKYLIKKYNSEYPYIRVENYLMLNMKYLIFCIKKKFII